MNRYKIFYVNLDPIVGSETRNARPCLVVSPDEMNQDLDTVVVCPLTTNTTRNYPSYVYFDLAGVPNKIMLDQIRTIKKSRFQRFVGELQEDVIEEVQNTIQKHFVDMKPQSYIVRVNLAPTLAGENFLDCVIVSPKEMNEHLNTVVVCPIGDYKPYPTHVPFELNGERKAIIVSQIRVIDKSRIDKWLDVRLDNEVIERLKRVIKEAYVD